MKILAETPDGGSIVEFGRVETETLLKLKDSMDGADWQPKSPRGFPIDGDMERAFIAVIRFIEAKFAINKLRNLANELDEAIGVKYSD